MINVSGHRIGTAEVESALALNEQCAEAAVVGFTHDIKGQGIYAYVTLVDGAEPSDALRKELVTCAPVMSALLVRGRLHFSPVAGLCLPNCTSDALQKRFCTVAGL